MKRLIFAALSTVALFGISSPEILAHSDMPDDVRRTTTIELHDRVEGARENANSRLILLQFRF